MKVFRNMVFALAHLVLLGAATPVALAAEALGPDALVRKVTSEVLEAVRADKALQAGDRVKALALAEAKVLPHVDFREMTRLAMGRSWRNATPAQQDSLTTAFRSMLIRTYANAIDAYRGQTMDVLPVNAAANDDTVTVRNLYRRPGQAPIQVDYSMHRTPQGWKIHDIVIGGVSLVLTYRSEFDHAVQRSGIDGLISHLAKKNAGAAMN